MRRGEVAFRIIRDGRWQSVTLSDLDVVTDQDLALQAPAAARALVARLERGPWLRDAPGACWRRRPRERAA